MDGDARNLEQCRALLAMLDRIPSRHSRTDPETDPVFLRYYDLGRVHLDMDAVDRIAREAIHKARKRYSKPVTSKADASRL